MWNGRRHNSYVYRARSLVLFYLLKRTTACLIVTPHLEKADSSAAEDKRPVGVLVDFLYAFSMYLTNRVDRAGSGEYSSEACLKDT